MIKLLKASAGSGKTYRLTLKYISLLFAAKDPNAYRHILAVTFTNKATDEMKSRILKELHVLSTDPASSAYRKEFIPSVFPDEASLQKEAKVLLVNILHDYSAFSVSTIDRFFQQTLKAFSREIGQFASYQVELDKASLVAESVDRVLDSLSEDQPELLSWLKDSVMARLEQGGRYNMDSSLLDVAKALKSDQRRRLVEKYGIDETKTTSRANLAKTADALVNASDSFEEEVKERAAAIKKCLDSNGIDLYSDTKGKTFQNGVGKCLDFPKRTEIPVPSDSFLEHSSDMSAWFKKADLPKYAFLEDELVPLVENFAILFTGVDYKVYMTSRALLGKIRDLGIVSELNAEYNALLKEKNIMCLDDSNTILRDIIDGSDAPFIYEKIGVRYDHFLLDEFQDTSKVQWENFRPLLEESDSRGCDNLLVGDVKQSIYRWRGSDWDLMAKDVPQQISGLQQETMGQNFRSLQRIVDFNSGFFKYCAQTLDLVKPVTGDQIPISDLYSDVNQQFMKGADGEGLVEVMYVGNEDQEGFIIGKVNEVHEAGAKYSEIAVLVRTNDQAAEIASALIGEGIPVISDEALHVKSSITVRRLVSLMSLVNSPGDSVSGYLANTLGMDFQPKGCMSLVDMAEGILRGLRKAAPEMFESEVQYIQAFMDNLQDYVNLEGNDLSGFLAVWNSANPSIGSPAGADAVKIMTIHKSKGLQFPYVIIPHVEKMSLYSTTLKWSHADVEGTALEGVVEDVYQVNLSGKSSNTLFEGEYVTEEYLQRIDSINTLYVALTRAEKGLCVIGAKAQDGASDMSQILYSYLSDCPEFTNETEGDISVFTWGQMYDFANMKRELESDSVLWHGEYPSYPLNTEEFPRLRIRTSSADFFAEDGRTGIDASGRLRGIVLHDILSEVVVPSDLEKAVRRAESRGDLSMDEAVKAYELLNKGILDVSSRGWFPDDPSLVCNESTIVDTDGTQHRPDRVVFSPDGGVMIIDYKFGKPDSKYLKQIRRYADLYRKMGYEKVSASLWYVLQGEILS